MAPSQFGLTSNLSKGPRTIDGVVRVFLSSGPFLGFPCLALIREGGLFQRSSPLGVPKRPFMSPRVASLMFPFRPKGVYPYLFRRGGSSVCKQRAPPLSLTRRVFVLCYFGVVLYVNATTRYLSIFRLLSIAGSYYRAAITVTIMTVRICASSSMATKVRFYLVRS